MSTQTTEVKVLITADGQALATTARAGSQDLDRLKASAAGADAALGRLGTEANDTAQDLQRQARAATGATAANRGLAGSARGAAAATGASAAASARATGAANDLGAAHGRAATGMRGALAAATGLVPGLAGVGEAGAVGAAALGGVSAAALAAAAGIAVVVVGIGGLLAAGFAYEAQQERINTALARSGMAATLSAADITDAAAAIARDTGRSYDIVEQSLLDLATSGDFTAEGLREVGRVGADLADNFGIEVSEGISIAADAFRALAAEDTDALAEALVFLGDDADNVAKRLTEMGNSSEAQAELLGILADAADGGSGSVSESFGNMTGALGDLIGAMVESTGITDYLRERMELLGIAANWAASQIRDAIDAGRGAKYGDREGRLAKDDRETDITTERAEGRRRDRPTRATPRGRSGGGRGRAARDPTEGWEDQIDRLQGSFGALPADIQRVEEALEQVDELLAAIGDRPGPRFDRMRAELAELRPQIEASLGRPIRDILADQTRTIALLESAARGRSGETEQLRLQQDLMQRLGVENEEQLAIALRRRGVTAEEYRQLFANLDVMRQLTDEERRRNQVRAQRVAEVDRFAGNVRDTIGDVRTEGLGALTNFLNDLLDQVNQQLTDQLFEEFFGAMFRDLRQQMAGENPVEQAQDQFAQTIRSTASRLDALAVAARNATNGLNGAGVPPSEAANDNGQLSSGDEDIVVQGARQIDVLARMLTGLFGTFFGRDSELAQGMGEITANALRGAVQGQMASSLFGSLGIRQSSTGAGLGGAAGEALGKKFFGKLLGSAAGPIGSIVGGLLGGTLGGMLRSSKYGTASISNGADGLSSSVRGNSAAFRSGATSGANSAMGGIQSIATQLGGFISGNPSVSIGQVDGKWRVSTTGYTGKLRKKAPGVVDFGKDGEAAARSFAIADALADGVVSGISDKVRAALASSKDVEAALREAIKVDEIEQLLGGFGTAARRTFVDFERQAKERLRIAGKYGFDLVKLEEVNQRERAAILDEAISDVTGGLKQLLEDMISGERAAGSLVDRRAALLARKAELERRAATDARAAEELTRVLEQLYDVSIQAFGSAGVEFASDRATIQSSAEAIIAAATRELTQAQNDARRNAGTEARTTETLITESNQHLDAIARAANENNDQMAELLALMRNGAGPSATIVNFAAARAIGSGVMSS